MHLLKPAAAAAASGGCSARSWHLKFKLAASAPPRPAREAPASHWLLSQGPPAALPPGAPARCLSWYPSCMGLSCKGVMQTRHPFNVTNIPLCTVSGLVKKVNSDPAVYVCYYPQPASLHHRKENEMNRFQKGAQGELSWPVTDHLLICTKTLLRATHLSNPAQDTSCEGLT